MEDVQEPHALGGEPEAGDPSSPQEPRSPPPPPSPPAPAAPESPRLPAPEQPSEAHARQLLLEEWGPRGGNLELPPSLTWKLLFLRRPLYRNLLRSPNPEGAGGARSSGPRSGAVAARFFLPRARTQAVSSFPSFPCLSSVSASASLFLSLGASASSRLPLSHAASLSTFLCHASSVSVSS